MRKSMVLKASALSGRRIEAERRFPRVYASVPYCCEADRYQVYRGQAAYKLFLESYQHILWKQCYAMIHKKGLPAELWVRSIQSYVYLVLVFLL
jgi:hypothetical protein